MIEFTIYGQYLKRTDIKMIANKAKNVLRCKFEFKGKIWEDVDKYAIFKNRTDSYCMSLGNTDKGTCILPWEAITGKYFKVTVFGGDLATTNELTIPLVESGHTTNLTPTIPSHDVFAEIFESLSTKIDDLEFEDDKIKCYSGGELRDVISLPYVDIDDVKTYLQNERYVKKLRFNYETGELIFEN